ncbi:MAG: glycerophosphodiester phosphodiesterase [Dehalococcoidia bacterium]|nr:glycerophosphodiester phosphodiesterase [Dehalococcoidia bacterium]
MSGPPDDRPLAIAHRGGNDLETLEAALAAGVDYLEADLWFYRRRLEVRHDKTTGPLPILWERWSLRPDFGPRLLLPAVLDAARGRGRLFLDLKGDAAGLAGALAKAVEDIGMGEDVAFCGGWSHLDRLRELLPHALIYYTVGSVERLELLRPRLERGEIEGVSIDSRFLTAEIVSHLKSNGVRGIFTWAIETPEAARQVVSWGVTGIISDNLHLLALIGRGELP